MRITVVNAKGTFGALTRQMTLEGDFVTEVSKPSDAVECDLVITDTTMIDSPAPVVGGDREIPAAMASAFGYDASSARRPEFFLSKWFDRIAGWGDQTLIGIPLYGLMNNNLSVQVPVGSALRYINKSPLSDMFSNVRLEKLLHDASFTGFVSIWLILGDSPLVTNISTFLPFYSLFAVIEGCTSKISDFLSGTSRLRESWTVSLLVSRWPFPAEGPVERVNVNGLHNEVLRHFWTPYVHSHRKSYYTDNTLIGIATSWSPHLREANRRSVRTAGAIQVENKQYRTDLASVVQITWARIVEAGLLANQAEDNHDASPCDPDTNS